jgi:hypothetical protein
MSTNIYDKSTGSGVDQKLKEIDKEIEAKVLEMLEQEGSSPDRVPTTTTEDRSTEAAIVDTLMTRRKDKKDKDNKTSTTFIQLTEEDAEGLAKMHASMKEVADKSYTNLVDVFIKTTGFTSGLDRFMNLIQEQLKLTDVVLEVQRLQAISTKIVEARVIIIMLQNITDDKQTEALKQLELDLYTKVAYNLLQLQPKDGVSSLLHDLHRDVKDSLHNLTTSITKNTTVQKDAYNNLMKKSKS